MDSEQNILNDLELKTKLKMPVSELDFSVRTTNCLAVENIEFVYQLVCKNEDDLLVLRNFGRKCLAEIKKKLEDLGFSLGMRIDIELKSEKKGIAREQEEQLKLISIQDLPFSERARHVLEKSGRRNLYDLLAISNENLLAHKNCGRKTAAEILSIRDQYIKKQMNPEAVLEVTFEDFLNMIKESFMNESALAEIVRDPKAIYIWQNRYCSAKKKTLEELGNHFGVTRERIRQLESNFIKKTLLKRVDSSYQRFMKHFLEDVRLNEGIKFYVGSETLLEAPEFEVFNNLLGFIDGRVFFDRKWKAWITRDAKFFGLVERFIALECIHKGIFTQSELDVLFNDFFNGKVNGRGRRPKKPGPRNVPSKELFKKSCVSLLFIPLKEGYLYTKAVKAEVLQDVIRIGFPNGLAIYRDLDQLGSLLVEMGLDKFFGASGRALSMSVARAPNVILWDWGIYIHTSNIKVDIAILERVKNWLNNKFSAGVDRVSLWGAFTELEQDCKASGIPNEHALYSCMKMHYNGNYYFTHDPHVMKSRINVKSRMIDCVEEYIRDSEEAVSLDEIENHFGLKDFQVLQRIDDLDEVFPCEGRHYVHINHLSIDESLLKIIKDSVLRDISTNEHISIKNVYENNIVYCKQQNIMDAKVLYSLMSKKFGGEIFFPNYPHVVSKDHGINWTGRFSHDDILMKFFSSKKGVVFKSELVDYFQKERGYSESLINNMCYLCEDILEYAKDAYVMKATIGWSDIKQSQLEQMALTRFENGCISGQPYAYIDDLLEDDLPRIDENGSIHWQKRLLKTLLEGGDSIRVVGTLGDMYIAVPNGFRIETTDDLIGFLLEQKFGGATNRGQFINYLAKIRLTKVLNPKASQYSIKNEEVMVNRNLLNAN